MDQAAQTARLTRSSIVRQVLTSGVEVGDCLVLGFQPCVECCHGVCGDVEIERVCPVKPVHLTCTKHDKQLDVLNDRWRRARVVCNLYPPAVLVGYVPLAGSKSFGTLHAWANVVLEPI